MEISFEGKSEYSQEIIAWLKKREKEIRDYKRQSPQIHRRRHLVDWTCVVADTLNLTKCSVHLAIRILDYFMDGHDIKDPQLYLVCLGSLLLASKVEEKDSNVPKCSEMNTFAKNVFALSDFKMLELVILKYFNWNIFLPTACHFVEMWLPESIYPSDYRGPPQYFSDAKTFFLKYVEYFMDLSTQDSSLVDVVPSLVAAAIIAASRSAFGLSPTWNIRLELMTGYDYEILQPILLILSDSYKRHSEEDADNSLDDGGYFSCTNSPDKSGSHLSCSEVMDCETGTEGKI